MRKKLVFEQNDVLYKLSEEEIYKRKQRRMENVKKTASIKVYIRPDLDDIVKKLKIIKMEEQAIKNKKRIQVIDTSRNMIFFK